MQSAGLDHRGRRQPDSGCRIHHCAEIVPATLHCLSQVQAHPHPNIRTRPSSAEQSILSILDSRNRIRGALESGKERFARSSEGV